MEVQLQLRVVKRGSAEVLTSWNPNGSKTTLTPQVKSEVHKPQYELTLNSKTCFKCEGLRHIDSECPNQKVIALIEEDLAMEEDIGEVVESIMCKKMRRRVLCCQNLSWRRELNLVMM